MARTAAAKRPPHRRRRTQAQRRLETRGAVLDATIECLADLGYARTTTTRIARRAGVSRGALLHHYPSKQDLLAAAVDHVLQRRTEEFRVAFTALPEHADRLSAAIDFLWAMFCGSTFDAWLELLVAARSDRELHARVAEVAARFYDTVEETYRQLFPMPEQPSRLYELAPSFAFAVLQGIALERIAFDETQERKLLDALKAWVTEKSGLSGSD